MYTHASWILTSLGIKNIFLNLFTVTVKPVLLFYFLQAVAEAQYWYYVTELSFYISLLLCVSVDTKRKVRST